jgi:hypothetical protein
MGPGPTVGCVTLGELETLAGNKEYEVLRVWVRFADPGSAEVMLHADIAGLVAIDGIVVGETRPSSTNALDGRLSRESILMRRAFSGAVTPTLLPPSSSTGARSEIGEAN